MKSKSILAFILGVSTALQAQDTAPQTPEMNSSGFSGQFTSESIGPTVFADALIWQAQQVGTFGFGAKSEIPGGLQEEFLFFAFPWDWGVRAGIRYDTGFDHWTTQLYYTWFRTEAKSQTDNAAPIFMGNYNANNFNAYSEGNLRWSLLFNMFDWELGRNCFVCKTVLLNPFLGIKGGWIYQDIHAYYSSPGVNVTEHLRNDFYGVGPKVGMHGKWKLGSLNTHVFSLLGDFAGAFMWGHWSFKDDYESSIRAPLQTIYPNKTYGALMAETMFGLEWDIYFNKGRSQFSVRAGYEVQFWINQLQILTSTSGTTRQDLTLQGGTFELCCKF